MQNSNPALQARMEPPFDLEYHLRVEDFVDYWLYLACKLPARLPLRVQDRLVGVLMPFFFLIALVGVVLPFVFMDRIGMPSHLSGGVMLALGFMVVMLASILCSRPTLYLVGPLRWLCWLSLRNLARAKVRGGSIDTVSQYRFAMTTEGVTQTAEQGTMMDGRGVVLRSREERISWQLIESIGGTDQHIFFLTDNVIPVIVPCSVFPDERSLDWFLQLARRYHEAEGAFLASSPDAVVGPLAPRPERTSAIQTGPEKRFTL